MTNPPIDPFLRAQRESDGDHAGYVADVAAERAAGPTEIIAGCSVMWNDTRWNCLFVDGAQAAIVNGLFGARIAPVSQLRRVA